MSISVILSALQAINALLPEVVTLVQAVEKAFPNATVDAKLEQVVGVLNSFQTLESELSSPISLITGIVKSLHPTNTPA